MKTFATISGALAVTACGFILYFIFIYEDDAHRVGHHGFPSIPTKIVFDGQQRAVEIEDSEGLVYIKKSCKKPEFGRLDGANYQAKIYYSDGNRQSLHVSVNQNPYGIAIFVYDTVKKSSDGTKIDPFCDFTGYCLTFDEPIPPKLMSCMQILLDNNKAGNFIIK